MNIVIMSWRGPGHPNAGGAEIVTWNHAQGWVKAGHQVTLFTSEFPGSKPREVIEGITIIRRGGMTFGVKLAAVWWYFFGDHGPIGLVVDEFHGLPFFSPLYVRGTKLAFIHEVAKEVWKLNPWPWPLNLIPGVLGSAFESWLFKGFYRQIPFMTVSESTKADLEAWGVSSQITVVHNGVELPTRLPQKSSKNPVVITYLGALSKDKGVEDGIKVFSQLYHLHPKWRFWIVGYGERLYLAQLKKKARELGVGRAIKFWGFVDQKTKFKLLAQSSVLINPSVREGWGLVVIEGAAVGTPTVGYDVPGLRDSIKDGVSGVLSSPNPESMVEKVEALILNQKRLQKLSVGAKKWSNQFKWQRSTKLSLQLIKSLLD